MEEKVLKSKYERASVSRKTECRQSAFVILAPVSLPDDSLLYTCRHTCQHSLGSLEHIGLSEGNGCAHLCEMCQNSKGV